MFSTPVPKVSQEIIVDFPKPHVLLVTFNRPKALNAFTPQMSADLRLLLNWFEEEPELWVAVFTGAGRAFSAGADLKAWHQNEEAGESQHYDTIQSAVHGFGSVSRRVSRKPFIAAVNGSSYGGGTEFVVNCDLVVASQDATFVLPEVKRGVVAVQGAIPRLSRIVGHQLASEMLLLGEPIKADDARNRFGFVNIVVPPTEVVQTALALAEKITSNSPDSVQSTKVGLTLAQNHGAEVTVLLHSRSAEHRGQMMGDNVKEGLRAFSETGSGVEKCGDTVKVVIVLMNVYLTSRLRSSSYEIVSARVMLNADYIASNPEVIPPNNPYPSFQLWVEDSATNHQHDATHDSHYETIHTLTTTALRQLCFGRGVERICDIARQIARTPQARRHLGQTVQVSEEEIRQHLLTAPLKVVFKAIPDDVNGGIIWGQAHSQNEVVINVDLVSAICNPACTDSDTGLRFLFFVTLSHEIVHTVMKTVFPRLVTPHIVNFEEDGKGQGEAGNTFEVRLFGFLTDVTMAVADITSAERLSRIQEFTADYRSPPTTGILDAKTMRDILSSLDNVDAWSPLWSMLPGANFDPTMQRRMRGHDQRRRVDGGVEDNGILSDPTRIARGVCDRGILSAPRHIKALA
ncbi:hypothetical protein MIND_00157700 [Mycena indigotica]|uniref:Enoyl-CoA hydratase n=1 Tax=Mycena indigotica TaxID=2126181 RepID=A0A8H6WL32_9AGAR|nr:uncharacterized protein MIND_00157700 [Mycena indigotica]KAF7316389.1 hypothetical protein MIND_00157700 [Mycena indigotica]